MNTVAVQILKQDWPSKWPSFITDIVSASKTSELLCENSMVILKLLSEEIFDFSRGELTTVCSLCQTPASLWPAPACLRFLFAQLSTVSDNDELICVVMR